MGGVELGGKMEQLKKWYEIGSYFNWEIQSGRDDGVFKIIAFSEDELASEYIPTGDHDKILEAIDSTVKNANQIILSMSVLIDSLLEQRKNQVMLSRLEA